MTPRSWVCRKCLAYNPAIKKGCVMCGAMWEALDAHREALAFMRSCELSGEAGADHPTVLRALDKWAAIFQDMRERAGCFDSAVREAIVLLDSAAEMARDAYPDDPCEPWKDYEEARDRLKEVIE